jgi:hypothetical protein
LVPVVPVEFGMERQLPLVEQHLCRAALLRSQHLAVQVVAVAEAKRHPVEL